MNLAQLKTFVMVAKVGNVTRAAALLNLSQPAVSGHIKALEDELGADLFQRNAGGVRLTPLGNEILPDAELVTRTVRAILERNGDRAPLPSGTLTIATIVGPEFLNLGGFMQSMQQCFPQISVTFQHCLSGEALARVHSGEISAGFFIGEQPEAPVAAIEVKKVNYVVVAPPSWKQQIAGMSLADLAGLPWIASAKSGSRQQLIRNFFAACPLQPVHAAEANSERTVLALVASGVGLSLVREEAARAEEKAGQCAIWSLQRHESRLYFIYHEQRAEDPLVKAAADVVRSLWEGK
jgi:DNA-binding transcriptional LysR family regulator